LDICQGTLKSAKLLKILRLRYLLDCFSLRLVDFNSYVANN